MAKYLCESCNYQTHNAENFIKHKNTGKHAIMYKATHGIRCQYCDRWFAKNCHLVNHLVYCKQKPEPEIIVPEPKIEIMI
jgi:hypothetical protein